MTQLLESLKIGARREGGSSTEARSKNEGRVHGNRYIGRLFKQEKENKRRDVSPTGLHQAKEVRRPTKDGVKK